MQAHENNRGARHRILILTYITWLTLSLAPAMVAPPERTFQQGQPEMQQSMDNMVTRQTVITKRTDSSSKGKVQGMDQMPKFSEDDFTTFKLLTEAEKILKTLPESKEREWAEVFVERMQEIAKMLEEKHKSIKKDSDSLRGTAVPDGLPKQLALSATSAVPEIKPFQKPVSKIQMTSPEINRVLSDDDHQAVTKPVALSLKMDDSESDELVRELESLHKETVNQIGSENPKVINHELPTTTPSSPFPSESKKAVPFNGEEEKAKMKAKLMKEIEDFHRLGGVMPKHVIDILYADSNKVTDVTQNRKINMDDEMKFTEAGMKDRRGIYRLDDVNNENKEISTANMNMQSYAANLKVNQSFPYKHPNMVQSSSGYYYPNAPPMRRAQAYEGRHLNINPKMNSYNQRYHDLAMLNPPDASAQTRPHIIYNGRLPPNNYRNYFMRQSYGPYPYMYNWNPQNSTIHVTQMMSPYVANQAKIGTQLSDEMKRELRDGKIIVLSDSVLRSNFEPGSTEKSTQVETTKQEAKNETITQN